MKVRPDIDEYFLKISKVVGERATCIRRQIGAVAVRDKHILSTGYNGAPSGMKDCLELGCLRDQNCIKSGAPHDLCRSVHAEQNVIIQAALHGVSIEGATVYCTTAPCGQCARMLANAKIKRYVCYMDYPNKEARHIFKTLGIKFDILPEPTFDITKIGERVLVVDDDTFDEAGSFVGFKKDDLGGFYKKILSRVKYVGREDAETNDAWKQIIPYVIMHHKDKYLVLKRLPKSEEKRLHNAYSFGVGGHINPIDSASEGADVIEKGMKREIAEEVQAEIKKIKLVGFVYDDSNDVSRHHIGFIYDAELFDEKVEVLESDQLEALFVKREELPAYINGKESWAEIVYENYISPSDILEKSGARK